MGEPEKKECPACGKSNLATVLLCNGCGYDFNSPEAVIRQALERRKAFMSELSEDQKRQQDEALKTMLRAEPKNLGFFYPRYLVYDKGKHVGEFTIHKLTIQGVVYKGEGWLNIVLKENETVIARAKRTIWNLKSYVVEHSGKTYVFEKRRLLTNDWVLREGDQVVGSVFPFLSTMNWGPPELRTDLPDQMPLPVRVFLLALCIPASDWE